MEEIERETMRDCPRNCKRRDEIAAVELDSSTVSFPKKMKIQIDFTSEKFNLPSHELNQDRRLSALSPDKMISPVASSNSCGFLAGDIYSGDSVSCRSFGTDSNLLPKDGLRSVVDLEVNFGSSNLTDQSFETDGSFCIDNKFSRETTPSSEFYGDTNEMESPAVGRNKCFRKKLKSKKIPNQEEIDQFFAEAEKKEQKRFADKYNYDVAKDVPLEGRYQWVRLKP